MANLYNGEITEMADWITGENTVTGSNETDGLPASGKTIRNLLQKHLKNPIYLHLDTSDASYKIFSSVEAKDLYYNYHDESLLLGQFEGPSAYSIKASSLTPTTLNVKKYNTGGSCEILFQWSCIDQNEIIQQTPTSITIAVANSQGVQTGYSVRDCGQDITQLSVDVYQYLQEGRNAVTVTVQSTQFGAKATLSYVIYLVSIQIDVSENSFAWYNALDDSVTQLPVRIEYQSSVSESSIVHFYVDGQSAANYTLYEDSDYVIPLTSKEKLEQGPHHIVIYATNENNGVTVYSNILSIDFTVAVTDIDSELVQQIMLNSYYSFDDNTLLESIINKQYTFQLQQYSTFVYNWGIWRFDSTATYDVHFYIDDADGISHELASFQNVKVNTKGVQLKYSPEKQLSGTLYYTIGRSIQKNVIGQIDVKKFTYDITEQNGYQFKLTAKNKTNGIDSSWKPTYGDCNIDISKSVNFTDNNGWYQDSFRVQGVNNYAQITSFPLGSNGTSQFTFEIDFYTEYVDSEQDLLIDALGCIKIYPTSASIIDSSGNPIITTNFKSNERVKIAFSRYPSKATNSNYNQLVTIVTNGILERADVLNSVITLPTSTDIKIGGSNSGVRLYSIRYYNTPIYWKGCYNNWLYDFDDKTTHYQNNDIYDNVGQINISKCEKKIDTIQLIGNLGDILNSTEKVHSTIDKLTRTCPYDTSKNFTIYNCLVRKHGQSTLTYPIPSLKFWSNKQYDESVDPPVLESNTSIYAKQRYQMKDGCIPSNKWILQANFADSSGTHNGSIQRLIQNIWYNTQIKDGVKNEYKLRTPPQLFASNQTITIKTVPSTDPDYEDYKTVDIIAQGYNSEKKQWKNYQKTDFPYTIRISPDSFPCVIFYQETEQDSPKFLGQYVFMDDKKSDYIYGQRSIYNVAEDPFCLTNAHKGDDVSQNRIWDNKNVLRIELLSMDDDVVDYIKECSPIYSDPVNKNTYEFVYPDEDDITDDEKDQKFAPFVEFQHWVVSTKNDLNKFKSEAYKHLDLYKMAAYYIFCMIFGLVDSIDRNAQVKTYDGKHFWYEPWDADIACGNKNTGGIKWPPGTDRNTIGAGTTGESAGAFSGKNSVLWNNLEAWDEWKQVIIPNVAQGMYNAGLKYDSVISMFDDNYQNKWCEYMYDKSGEYKYIESGSSQSSTSKSSYLAWLQGARNTHRHWWLKTSIDYWFSKWGVGSFRESNFYITAYSSPTTTPKYIRIKPSQKGYFAWTIQSGGAIQDLTYGTPNEYIDFDIKSVNMSPKVPFFIYGASYIKELDLTNVSNALDGIEFGYSYDTESNVSYLEKLSINTKKTLITDEDSPYYGGYKLSSISDVACNLKNFAILNSLKYFDATGQYELGQVEFSSKIEDLRLAAVGLSSIECDGNNFTNLEIPNQYYEIQEDGNVKSKSFLQALVLNNCSWENVSFWNSYKDTNGEEYSFEDTDDEGNKITTTKIIYPGYVKTTDTLSIPTISFTGTTCSNNNSSDVIIKWLNSINNGKIGETVITFANLHLENIEWTDWSYENVIKLGNYYNKTDPNIRGKITLSSDQVITKEQLQDLTNYFGDDVFVLNSGGLVIDYPVDTTIITATGKNCKYDQESNSYEVTESGILNIRLNYTKFKLQETEYSDWKIQYKDSRTDIIIPGQSLVNRPNVSLIRQQDQISNKTTYYLQIKESKRSYSTSGDYTITIVTSTATMDILVHPVVYPEGTILFKDSSSVRFNYDHNIVFGSLSSTATMYLDETSATATATGYRWSVQNGDVIISENNSIYINPTDLNNNTSDDFYISLIDIPSIKLTYTLKVAVSYINDSVVYQIPIVITDDPLLVSDASSQVLITAMRRALSTIDGSNNYYKSDFDRITSFTISNIQTKLDCDTLLSTSTVNDSVFKYFTNLDLLTIGDSRDQTANSILFEKDIKEILQLSTVYTLSMDGCIPENDNIEFDFQNMPKLTSLSLPQQSVIRLKDNKLNYCYFFNCKEVYLDNVQINILNINNDLDHQIQVVDVKNCKYPTSPMRFVSSAVKNSLKKFTVDNYTITSSGIGDFVSYSGLLIRMHPDAEISISTTDTAKACYGETFKLIAEKDQSWYNCFEFTDWYVLEYTNLFTVNGVTGKGSTSSTQDITNIKNIKQSEFDSGKYTGNSGYYTSLTLTYTGTGDSSEVSTVTRVYKNYTDYIDINLLDKSYFGGYKKIYLECIGKPKITDYTSGVPNDITIDNSNITEIIYKHTQKCTITILSNSSLSRLKVVDVQNCTNIFSNISGISFDTIEYINIDTIETTDKDMSIFLNQCVANKDKLTLSGSLTAKNTHLTAEYHRSLDEAFPNITFTLGDDAMEFSSEAIQAYILAGYNCKDSSSNPYSNWKTSFIETDFSNIRIDNIDSGAKSSTVTFSLNGNSYTGSSAISKIIDAPETGYFNWGGGDYSYKPTNLDTSNVKSICVNFNQQLSNKSGLSWKSTQLFVQYINIGRIFKWNTPPGKNSVTVFWKNCYSEENVFANCYALIPDSLITQESAFNIGTGYGPAADKTYIFSKNAYPDFMSLYKQYKEYYDSGSTTVETLIQSFVNNEHVVSYSDYKSTGNLPT